MSSGSARSDTDYEIEYKSLSITTQTNGFDEKLPVKLSLTILRVDET